MALEGLAAALQKSMVGTLLIERDPGILDRTYGSPPGPLWDAYVTQIAAEVITVVGADPTAGPVRDLAVQCLAYGVASQIEYAQFPEQQTAGNVGRGWFLKQKYNELLAMLRTMPTGAAGVRTSVSKASFPPARPWPDPIRERR